MLVIKFTMQFLIALSVTYSARQMVSIISENQPLTNGTGTNYIYLSKYETAIEEKNVDLPRTSDGCLVSPVK